MQLWLWLRLVWLLAANVAAAFMSVIGTVVIVLFMVVVVAVIERVVDAVWMVHGSALFDY